jgi:hypothetical protein
MIAQDGVLQTKCECRRKLSELSLDLEREQERPERHHSWTVPPIKNRRTRTINLQVAYENSLSP